MYSVRLTELFHARAHGGDLPAPTHFGQAGRPGGGPWVQLNLQVNSGRVDAARWRTFGCPAAIACVEALCRWSEGRSLCDVQSVSAEQVVQWVDGVPEGKEHCPALAAQAARSLRPWPGPEQAALTSTKDG